MTEGWTARRPVKGHPSSHRPWRSTLLRRGGGAANTPSGTADGDAWARALAPCGICSIMSERMMKSGDVRVCLSRTGEPLMGDEERSRLFVGSGGRRNASAALALSAAAGGGIMAQWRERNERGAWLAAKTVVTRRREHYSLSRTLFSTIASMALLCCCVLLRPRRISLCVLTASICGRRKAVLAAACSCLATVDGLNNGERAYGFMQRVERTFDAGRETADGDGISRINISFLVSVVLLSGRRRNSPLVLAIERRRTSAPVNKTSSLRTLPRGERFAALVPVPAPGLRYSASLTTSATISHASRWDVLFERRKGLPLDHSARTPSSWREIHCHARDMAAADGGGAAVCARSPRRLRTFALPSAVANVWCRWRSVFAWC